MNPHISCTLQESFRAFPAEKDRIYAFGRARMYYSDSVTQVFIPCHAFYSRILLDFTLFLKPV